jgi:type VI secretion system protein ImpH
MFARAPWFDFFQAVRLLGRLYPGRDPIGREAAPSSEVVRFKTRPTLEFLPGPVLEIEPAGAGKPAEMTVAALSLTGAAGAMPYCYTELLIERAQDLDKTLASFIDLFHHRLVSLFYRAWERSRPALALEHSWDNQSPSKNGKPHNPSPFSDHLFALIGLGFAPLRGRHEFPDEALLYYVGFFAQRHRSAIALEAMLREYFALPIEVIQYVEHKLRLDPSDRTTLGQSGLNNRLGVDTIMGDRITDVAGKFRLRIGPMSIAQFRMLSPDGPLFKRLVQMTRLFVDTGLIFDVQLVLRAEDVPWCRLASTPENAVRLGQDTWVSSVNFLEDVNDVIRDSCV